MLSNSSKQQDTHFAVEAESILKCTVNYNSASNRMESNSMIKFPTVFSRNPLPFHANANHNSEERSIDEATINYHRSFTSSSKIELLLKDLWTILSMAGIVDIILSHFTFTGRYWTQSDLFCEFCVDMIPQSSLMHTERSSRLQNAATVVSMRKMRGNSFAFRELKWLIVNECDAMGHVLFTLIPINLRSEHDSGGGGGAPNMMMPLTQCNDLNGIDSDVDDDSDCEMDTAYLNDLLSTLENGYASEIEDSVSLFINLCKTHSNLLLGVFDVETRLILLITSSNDVNIVRGCLLSLMYAIKHNECIQSRLIHNNHSINHLQIAQNKWKYTRSHPIIANESILFSNEIVSRIDDVLSILNPT